MTGRVEHLGQDAEPARRPGTWTALWCPSCHGSGASPTIAGRPCGACRGAKAFAVRCEDLPVLEASRPVETPAPASSSVGPRTVE